MPRYILDTPEDLTEGQTRNILSYAAPVGSVRPLPPEALQPARRRLEVHGRRWFQRSYGNTYHTVRIVLDGVEIYKSPKTYGYRDHYKQTAEDWLLSVGHITQEQKEARLFLREMFDYTETVQDVSREKDL